MRPFSRRMADAVTEACRRTGALLIADEIQCGLGRTGRPFYSSVLGLKPDLMAVGKALGAGVPIAAALFSERGRQGRGVRRSRQHLRRQSARVPRGARLPRGADRPRPDRARRARSARSSSAASGRSPRATPIVREVRGAGLIWGLDLDRPALPVVEAALELGLLVNRTSDTVVRLLPPYVITASEVDEALRPARAGDRQSCGGTRISERFSDHCGRRGRRTSPAIHRLITDNLEVGHLLPRTHRRTSSEHVARFVVRAKHADDDARASAAPSWRRSAPASPKCGRSSSTKRSAAGTSARSSSSRVAADGDGQRIRDAVRVHARAGAFRAHGLHHRAAHLGAGEDRARLHGCALFRRCGQHAVMLPLRAGVAVGPERPAAVIHGSRARAATRGSRSAPGRRRRGGSGVTGIAHRMHPPIEGGVTAPRGFRAAGVACGIKASGKLDLVAARLGRSGERRRRLHDQPGAGGAGAAVARAPGALGGHRPRGRRSTAAAPTPAPAPTAAITRAAMADYAAAAVGCEPRRCSSRRPASSASSWTCAKVERGIDGGGRAAVAGRRRRRGARHHDDRSVPEGIGGRGRGSAAGRSASAAWPRARA